MNIDCYPIEPIHIHPSRATFHHCWRCCRLAILPFFTFSRTLLRRTPLQAPVSSTCTISRAREIIAIGVKGWASSRRRALVVLQLTDARAHTMYVYNWQLSFVYTHARSISQTRRAGCQTSSHILNRRYIDNTIEAYYLNEMDETTEAPEILCTYACYFIALLTRPFYSNTCTFL